MLDLYFFCEESLATCGVSFSKEMLQPYATQKVNTYAEVLIGYDLINSTNHHDLVSIGDGELTHKVSKNDDGRTLKIT